MRIAINGLGRIGRTLFRVGYKKLNIFAINSPSDARTMAHLLEYDSVYGKFLGKIKYTKDSLIVNGKKIRLFFKKDPEELPWRELKIDLVAECSGVFRHREDMQKHLRAGAKAVVLSAPCKNDADITLVRGVNDRKYRPRKHKLVSVASCTTNCFVPVVKVIDDHFGIKKGFMVTTHAYTGDQKIVDSTHDDLRRARAAAINIVPTTSGAAVSTSKVLPNMRGKLHSSAMRVPVPSGSVIYFTCETKRKNSVDKVNRIFKKESKGKMKGIIEYADKPLVSSDVIGNSHSAIFDSLLTEVDGDLLKVVAWYDNEWGYSNRLMEVIKMIKV